jgi:hypothetical protein
MGWADSARVKVGVECVFMASGVLLAKERGHGTVEHDAANKLEETRVHRCIPARCSQSGAEQVLQTGHVGAELIRSELALHGVVNGAVTREEGLGGDAGGALGERLDGVLEADAGLAIEEQVGMVGLGQKGEALTGDIQGEDGAKCSASLQAGQGGVW